MLRTQPYSDIKFMNRQTVFKVWGIRSSGDNYNSTKLNIELTKPSEYFSVESNIITCIKSGIYLVSVPGLLFSAVGDDVGVFSIGDSHWIRTYCGTAAASVQNKYAGYFSCSSIVNINAGDKITAQFGSKNIGSRVGYNTNVSEAIPTVFFYLLKSLE